MTKFIVEGRSFWGLEVEADDIVKAELHALEVIESVLGSLNKIVVVESVVRKVKA